jgi:AbrB family looped-hinge helix DNA binding protein
VEIVKVQLQKTNAFISIPREIRETLGLKKGDKMLMKIENGKIVVEKC